MTGGQDDKTPRTNGADNNGRRQAMQQARRNGQARGNQPRMWMQAAALAALVAGAGASGGPVQAQGLFSPVLWVNNRVITTYEMEQRILFMQILRQPGDIEELARQTLIEDRLRLAEADRLGLKATPEQVAAGMAEFASRANLTTEQFIEAVGQAGVDPQTFRDFVEAGIIWRDVVRARYAGTVTITDAEVDRAMATFVPESVPTVRVAEIVLPGAGPERSASLALARKLAASIKTEAEFFAAARAHSTGPSAGSGGQRDWQRLTALDDASRTVVGGTAPGRVSPIVQTDTAVILYLVLDRAEEQLSEAEKAIKIDYAEYLIPDGPGADAEAAQVRAAVDTCDDLLDVNKGQPADRLSRHVHALGAVPADVSGALTLLDTGETSSSVRRGAWRVFLMVCRRGVDDTLMPARDDARAQLTNQRLGTLAELYLSELQTEAILREP